MQFGPFYFWNVRAHILVKSNSKPTIVELKVKIQVVTFYANNGIYYICVWNRKKKNIFSDFQAVDKICGGLCPFVKLTFLHFLRDEGSKSGVNYSVRKAEYMIYTMTFFLSVLGFFYFSKKTNFSSAYIDFTQVSISSFLSPIFSEKNTHVVLYILPLELFWIFS
jgi:hypothetical protein